MKKYADFLQRNFHYPDSFSFCFSEFIGTMQSNSTASAYSFFVSFRTNFSSKDQQIGSVCLTSSIEENITESRVKG